MSPGPAFLPRFSENTTATGVRPVWCPWLPWSSRAVFGRSARSTPSVTVPGKAVRSQTGPSRPL